MLVRGVSSADGSDTHQRYSMDMYYGILLCVAKYVPDRPCCLVTSYTYAHRVVQNTTGVLHLGVFLPFCSPSLSSVSESRVLEFSPDGCQVAICDGLR